MLTKSTKLNKEVSWLVGKKIMAIIAIMAIAIGIFIAVGLKIFSTSQPLHHPTIIPDDLQNILNIVENEMRLNGTTMDLSLIDLSNVKGSTLAELINMFPKVTFFNMYSCKLTGKIISDMLNEINKQGIILKENLLGLWSNNLSDIDGKSLTKLINVLKQFSDDTFLKWSDYNLAFGNLQDLVYSSGDIKFKWSTVDLSETNLASISGTTLAKLFQLFPNLQFLNLYSCNLSGTIISDMLNECNRLGITLKEDVLGLWKNNLSVIDGETLFNLISVLKRFDNDTALKWSDYDLSVDNLKDLLYSSTENANFKWNNVDLSLVNLASISGITLAKIFQLFPHLEFLNMHSCNLSGIIISDMLNECNKLSITLKEDALGLWSNNLSDIDGESLAELLNVLKRFDKDTALKWSDYNLSLGNLQDLLNSSSKTYKFKWKNFDLSEINLFSISGATLAKIFQLFPKLEFLNMYNCRLSGTVISDMINECYKLDIVLKQDLIGLWSNNLSDISGESLTMLLNVLKRFDNDTALKWSDYNLTVSNLRDLLNSSGENGSRFNWRRIDLSNINLSSINGTTLGILFKIFPDMYYLDMRNCNLTDMIIDDMLKECDRQGIVLKGKTINIIHNCLPNHYQESLATIIT
ncbi:uncharacterized protein LOC117102833 isoform X1 [Anneissia japonica]|uniref:uncharacterized protein LOC117102833 isoform X1 n=1 Tax=Anneissia japonica TaxID=1529436 RepID=UPI0014255B77|nr:uncharacterized protein LOC117102833 isoform X1 [Anneissia japonica]